MTWPRAIDKFCLCPVCIHPSIYRAHKQSSSPGCARREREKKLSLSALQTFYALFFIKFLMSPRVCMRVRAAGQVSFQMGIARTENETFFLGARSPLLLFRLQLKSFDSRERLVLWFAAAMITNWIRWRKSEHGFQCLFPASLAALSGAMLTKSRYVGNRRTNSRPEDL